MAVLCVGFVPRALEAKPGAGPLSLCEFYPDVPACKTQQVSCEMCHTIAPTMNVFGEQIKGSLAPGVGRPLSAEAFLGAMPAALAAVAGLDADEDGVGNEEELRAGSSPSDAGSVPVETGECKVSQTVPGQNVCQVDLVYVYKKVKIDFCGLAPTFEQLETFKKNPTQQGVSQVLGECLQSEHWRGKEGVVWHLANKKIRPLQAIKSGPESGGALIPLADYLYDYNYFVYVHTGGRDVRELLTGTYFVTREDQPGKTVYTKLEDVSTGEQGVAKKDRAGMLTHAWFLMLNTMFTAVPRTTAAQAYRAYLGHDIAKLEGLSPIAGEPKDYDAKGVEEPACAVCHTTLDPLSYPFSRYQALDGGIRPSAYRYNRNRLSGGRFDDSDGPRVSSTPEAGAIFGQPVQNLVQWAQVAANSDDFAKATVRDYWTLLLGEEPRATELEQFNRLWTGLREKDNYSVEAMLHRLIQTEAYGVP